ncbi:MAG: 16S rRNA (cytosine(1402)-N(4))-methyltransferase RsmH [Candidatus Solibacter usitatus]|nr:16S rRNA (cytosine(1402)-N(4))-methyltransferase RsmH [Candidatus Solibacter usitatus]
MTPFHIPVLSKEVLEHLAVRPDAVYLDVTAGLGGLSMEIAKQLTTGFVIANDRDAESLELARRNTSQYAEKIRFHHGRFSRVGEALESYKVERVAGLVADLGVSRYQLTDPERGFTLMADGPLDMRLDRGETITAEQVVNYTDEETLANWFYQLAGERRSRRIARAIRQARPIRSTGHLARVIEEVVPRTGRLHPATKTFAAIRQVVNQEPEELNALLELVPKLVMPGGRAVFLTFHSDEDRPVKHFFQRLAREGRAQLLTKHVVKPGRDEVLDNAAARSSMLRAIQLN